MRLVVLESAEGRRMAVNPDHVRAVREVAGSVVVDTVAGSINVKGGFMDICERLVDPAPPVPDALPPDAAPAPARAKKAHA